MIQFHKRAFLSLYTIMLAGFITGLCQWITHVEDTPNWYIASMMVVSILLKVELIIYRALKVRKREEEQ